jgi:hypothetical protein
VPSYLFILTNSAISIYRDRYRSYCGVFIAGCMHSICSSFVMKKMASGKQTFHFICYLSNTYGVSMFSPSFFEAFTTKRGAQWIIIYT